MRAATIFALMSLADELTRCWDALNAGDPNAFLDLYDPEIELFVPAWVNPEGGVYRGADAVNRWHANNFAQWADQRWELIETFEQGPSVAFVLKWGGRGKRSGIELGTRFFGVMTFRKQKIVTIVYLGELREGVSH